MHLCFYKPQFDEEGVMPRFSLSHISRKAMIESVGTSSSWVYKDFQNSWRRCMLPYVFNYCQLHLSLACSRSTSSQHRSNVRWTSGWTSTWIPTWTLGAARGHAKFSRSIYIAAIPECYSSGVHHLHFHFLTSTDEYKDFHP